MAIQEYLCRVFPGTVSEFYKKADEALLSNEKMFIITANPEIMMHGERDEAVRSLLMSSDTTIVPDGIGVVKAMRICGIDSKGRVTGVDLAEHLLEVAGKAGKSVFLLGAKEEAVSALAAQLRKKHPQITVNYRNGYDGDKDEIFEEIVKAQPDLVLVALGVPAQEKLIAKHYGKFQKGIFIGAGGSVNVLSGFQRRSPAIFVKTNTEWLHRILREPSRLGRFYQNNVKFLGAVKKASKQEK